MRSWLAVLLVVLTACSASPRDDGSTNVVAAFYPLYEATLRVAGPEASVTNLTARGVEPHDMELTTKQVDVVRAADVVVYFGGGFQPSLERAVHDTQGRTVNALAGLDTIPGDPHVWLDPSNLSNIAGRIAEALAKASPADADAFADRALAY